MIDGFERTLPKSPKENPESFCLTFGVYKIDCLNDISEQFLTLSLRLEEELVHLLRVNV